MFEECKTVVFALDGTIYRGAHIIKGAPEAVARCRELGKSVFFLTNSSEETRSQVFQKLRALGVSCTFREVLTCGYVTAQYARKEKLANIHICGSLGLKSECEQLGVHCVAPEDAQNLIIGFDPAFNLETLQAAVQVAPRAHKVIACNRERSHLGNEASVVPGCGGIVAAIEWCSGRLADYTIGKPNTLMLETVREQINVAREQILVVGDTYDTDILMANRYGCPSVLISEHAYRDTICVSNIGEFANLLSAR